MGFRISATVWNANLDCIECVDTMFSRRISFTLRIPLGSQLFNLC